MKTQQEVNNFFQENTVHVAAICKIVQYLKDLNLKLPNNVILHEKGIDQSYFFKWFENKTSLNKIEYPKTYLACKIQIHECFGMRQIMGYNFYLLEKLQKLLLCRDTYWKIAGNKMGLGKSWKPDWMDGEYKFCICTTKSEITLCKRYVDNKILSFPTEEMRDTFYENFKDLIEECKDLL